jgi:hypothetical protein
VFRPTLTCLALMCLAACGPKPKEFGPIANEARALEVAREVLGDRLNPETVKISLEAGTWNILVPAAPGDPSQSTSTITLDAKSGRFEAYSDEVVDVAIIKPAAK